MLNIAKSRFYHRLEKLLITVESVLVAGFVGLCWHFILHELTITGGVMLGVFLWVVNYKRHKINKERR